MKKSFRITPAELNSVPVSAPTGPGSDRYNRNGVDVFTQEETKTLALRLKKVAVHKILAKFSEKFAHGP